MSPSASRKPSWSPSRLCQLMSATFKKGWAGCYIWPKPGERWSQKERQQVSPCLHPKEEGRHCWHSRRQPWHTPPSECPRFQHGNLHCSRVWIQYIQLGFFNLFHHKEGEISTGWIHSQGRDVQPERGEFYWRVVEGVRKRVSCLESVLVTNQQLPEIVSVHQLRGYSFVFTEMWSLQQR